MGIETVLLVGFVIIVVGVIVGLNRAKRRAKRESGTPPGAGTSSR